MVGERWLFFTTETQRAQRRDCVPQRWPHGADSENKKSSVNLRELRVSVVKKRPEITPAHPFTYPESTPGSLATARASSIVICRF